MRILKDPILGRIFCVLPLLAIPLYVLEYPGLAYLPGTALLVGSPLLLWVMAGIEILFLSLNGLGLYIPHEFHFAAQSLGMGVLLLSPYGTLNFLGKNHSDASRIILKIRRGVYHYCQCAIIVLFAGMLFRNFNFIILTALLLPHLALAYRLYSKQALASMRLQISSIILFAVVLCICAGILELGLRILIPVDNNNMNMFTPHADYIYMLTPGFSAAVPVTPYESGISVDVQVDISKQGFRDKLLEEKKPGEYRILVLGDSYTFGWAVPVGEAYPQQLEEMFANDGGGRNIRVINGGMPGSGPWQHYGVLLERGLAIKPDMLIVQTNIANDLIDTARRENFYLKTFLLDQERQIILYKNMSNYRFSLHDKLRKTLRTYYVLSKISGDTPLIVDFMNSCRLFRPIELPRVPAPIERPWNLEADLVDWYPEMDRAWAMMQEDLLKFKVISEREHTPLLIFNTVIPIDLEAEKEKIKKNPECHYEFYKGYHLVQQFCADNDIDYIPLLEDFEAHPNRASLILPADGHMSQEGNGVVASALYDYLMEHYPLGHLVEKTP